MQKRGLRRGLPLSAQRRGAGEDSGAEPVDFGAGQRGALVESNQKDHPHPPVFRALANLKSWDLGIRILEFRMLHPEMSNWIQGPRCPADFLEESWIRTLQV